MAGTATSATQVEYGDEHVRRLRLIKALTDVVGLPVANAREVLRLIDRSDDLFDSLGQAVAALPPYVEERSDYPRARAALATLGQVYDPRFAATAQFGGWVSIRVASGGATRPAGGFRYVSRCARHYSTSGGH